MNDIDAEIRNRVEAFVSEISSLVRKAALSRIAEALSAEGPVSVGKKGRVQRATSAPSVGKRAKGAKRTPEQMDALTKAIVKSITTTPGIRADQIASELGIATKELALPIKKLLEEKTIAKKGQKRATSYSVKK